MVIGDSILFGLTDSLSDLMMKVENGDTIEVAYEGRFTNNEVFDSSDRSGRLLEFRVGAGMVVKGFDKAVVGMEEGESKEITLKPEEAYGEPDEKLRQKVPRNALPEGAEPKEGMQLVMHAPNGQQALVRIAAVDKETVTLDLNHPLAGKTLIFKITIKKIQKETERKAA